MTRKEAESLARAHIDQLPVASRYEIVLDDEKTREEMFGWVFFYNSRRFIETGDVDWGLGGNAPLIVDVDSRQVVTTGTARPIDDYIAYYKTHRTLDGFA